VHCWSTDLEGGLRSEGGWLGHGWRCMGAHRDREGAGEQKHGQDVRALV
jgi:hypothetical protein